MNTGKVARCIVGAALVASLAGCGDGGAEKARLQAELDSARKELDAIKRELDELKYGAGRLLSQAEQATAAGKWADAKTAAQALISRHPSAPEAAKAAALVAGADSALAVEAEHARKEVARQEAEAKAKKAEEERRLAQALSKMRKKEDKVRGINFYQDASSPVYTNANGFFLYIAHRPGSQPSLRFQVQYYADDWLFVESLTIVADERRFQVVGPRWETDHGGGDIWEWIDVHADEQYLEIARAVMNAKDVTVRFNGRQYYKDRKISAAQKTALRNVFDAYQVLSGR